MSALAGKHIMRITELFASIQGESTLQGLPCLFVRCTGCNLDCGYCDTRYARSGGTEISLADIIDRIEASGLSHVCITGGEPLLQHETIALAGELVARDYVVSVETNGSIDASPLPDPVIRVIDVKCPGSGEAGTTAAANLEELRGSDEFKFVIGDRRDFDFAVEATLRYRLQRATVLFSPIADLLAPATLAEWILDEFPAARLNLQLHKLIWPDAAAGDVPR